MPTSSRIAAPDAIRIVLLEFVVSVVFVAAGVVAAVVTGVVLSFAEAMPWNGCAIVGVGAVVVGVPAAAGWAAVVGGATVDLPAAAGAGAAGLLAVAAFALDTPTAPAANTAHMRDNARARTRTLDDGLGDDPLTPRAYPLGVLVSNALATRPSARAPRAQPIEWPSMAPKQRQVRMEQRGAFEAIQSLEQRSDEELEAETKYKSAAMAILGARASERFDAEAARGYFQRAIAAARPQERMQIRRMADASLALAERRAGDLKDAVERLGQAPPSGRQMFALRAMGLLIPPSSAGALVRIRGGLLIFALILVLLAIGLGLVELVSLPFGGLGLAPGILLGLFVMIAALAIVAAIGRRRRDRARAG